MCDKQPARSAAAKPKGKADRTTTRAAAAKPASQAAAGRPMAARRRTENMHEHIQRRAYELWESEGRPAGREHAHWLQAEGELARARTQNSGASR